MFIVSLTIKDNTGFCSAKWLWWNELYRKKNRWSLAVICQNVLCFSCVVWDAKLPEENSLYSSQGELMDWIGRQRQRFSKKGWKNFLILPALWVCLPLADSPRLSLGLYYDSGGSAIPVGCTVNVVGAIWFGFCSELAAQIVVNAFWQWYSQ